MASPLSHNDYIKIVKIKRIQTVLRGILFHRLFLKLKQSLQRLSDVKLTDPLQLLKMLSPADFNLLNSF